MTERLIIVTVDPGYVDTITAMAEQVDALDCQIYPVGDDASRRSVHLLVDAEKRQTILDRIQSALGGSENWRITMLPVEATIPLREKEPKEAEAGAAAASIASREELYNDVARNAKLDRNFIVFVVLSTIVAAIGLVEDNIAVVIGAMVIAPLLGPNLAFGLGVALGDRTLMGRAILTNAAGVMLTVGICAVIGVIWPVDLGSKELMARTEVGFDGMALALASGAAAALSLTTGLSSALVGVMVAVALLPPAAVVGLMLGAGNWTLALGAALLLAVNVVCVNLSTQIAFVLRGVHPRTWLEKKSARHALWINAVIWMILLAMLAALLILRSPKVS